MSFFMKVGNTFIRGLLSSPFHSLMSKNTLVIHFTGKKSGKQYATPVNYTQQGEIVRVTSQRDRVWWRNLKHNPDVSIRLRGKLLDGKAVVLDTPEQAAAGLSRFLEPAPQMAKYFGVSLLEDGSFSQPDLVEKARNTVVIEITLTK